MLARPHLRVLVVDDDAILTDLLATLLGVLGYAVQTSNSGPLALQQLATQQPANAHPIDIVLIDLRMPGMDGEALAAAISSMPHPPRLIGMSGATPSGDQAQHFHAFLQKPFSVEALQQALADPATASNPASRPLNTPPIVDPTILDMHIYERLRAAMPLHQLHDLYARTLAHIRELAPSIDTADNQTLLKQGHMLQGSCAMVGALELASLAAHIAETPQGSFQESPVSYILLRAAERLERILGVLSHPE